MVNWPLPSLYAYKLLNVALEQVVGVITKECCKAAINVYATHVFLATTMCVGCERLTLQAMLYCHIVLAGHWVWPVIDDGVLIAPVVIALMLIVLVPMPLNATASPKTTAISGHSRQG